MSDHDKDACWACEATGTERETDGRGRSVCVDADACLVREEARDVYAPDYAWATARAESGYAQ